MIDARPSRRSTISSRRLAPEQSRRDLIVAGAQVAVEVQLDQVAAPGLEPAVEIILVLGVGDEDGAVASRRAASTWKTASGRSACAPTSTQITAGSPVSSASARLPAGCSNQTPVTSPSRWSPCRRPSSARVVLGRLKLSSWYARDRSRSDRRCRPSRRARAASRGRRTADGAHVVGDEQDRLALVLQAPELLVALLLEGGVADGQDLVDDQHVGVELDGGRERRAGRACPRSSS